MKWQSKEDYFAKLKDPRWQKKRLEILERDEFSCRGCGDKDSTLHVHHLWYEGNNPWDAPTESLLTLCETCHEFETGDRKMLEDELLKTIRRAGFLAGHIIELEYQLDKCKDPIAVINALATSRGGDGA